LVVRRTLVLAGHHQKSAQHVRVDCADDVTEDLKVSSLAGYDSDGNRVAGRHGDPCLVVVFDGDAMGFDTVSVQYSDLYHVALVGAKDGPVIPGDAMVNAVIVARVRR
jgi:hypothetical protein